jgi:thiamine kinase-like enzyme
LNFSGFDIGNHFCEFMFDYQSAKEWPFFKVDFNLYPNENQQVNFCLKYFYCRIFIQLNFLTSYADTLITNQSKSIQMMNDLHTNRIDFDRNELAREIMKEANYFAMASHFFWTLWAINMAKSTAIKFGYMVSE